MCDEHTNAAGKKILYLSDKEIDSIIKSAMAHVLNDRDKRGQGEWTLAIGTFTPEELELRSGITSYQTRLGTGWQSIQVAVADKNSQCEASEDEKHKSGAKTTDYTLDIVLKDLAGEEYIQQFFFFSQSMPDTKNGDGSTAIKKKMAGKKKLKSNAIGVTAVAQLPFPPSKDITLFRRTKYKNLFLYMGKELFKLLSDEDGGDPRMLDASLDGDWDGGDDTLYDRITLGLERWGRKHYDKLVEIYGQKDIHEFLKQNRNG